MGGFLFLRRDEEDEEMELGKVWMGGRNMAGW